VLHEFLERRAHVRAARNEVFERLKLCQSIVWSHRASPNAGSRLFFSRRVVEASNRRMGNSRVLIVVDPMRNLRFTVTPVTLPLMEVPAH
jgi:hypothetical protein